MPPPDQLPAAFFAGLQTREPAAWREAFTRLWPVALQAARRVFTSAADAEDAAAAALADLAKLPALPDTWPACEALVAVIARRRAISQLRAHTALKRGLGETLSLDHAVAEPSVTTVTSAALDVGLLLDGIDPLRRRIIEEHFLDGRTSDEIGARLQLKPATIRSHLARALGEIRRRLNSPRE